MISVNSKQTFLAYISLRSTLYISFFRLLGVHLLEFLPDGDFLLQYDFRLFILNNNRTTETTRVLFLQVKLRLYLLTLMFNLFKSGTSNLLKYFFTVVFIKIYCFYWSVYKMQHSSPYGRFRIRHWKQSSVSLRKKIG